VARLLHRLGARIRAVEPYATAAEPMPNGVCLVPFGERELARADAVVVLTDHDVFDYVAVTRHATYVFDTRNRCHGPTVEVL
jgi:UDP-N-acetyl-D-glucosamine dehydrogenase